MTTHLAPADFAISPDAIELCGACSLPSEQGPVSVLCVYIEKRSYIPDVYVQVNHAMGGHHLAGDVVFLRAVSQLLRELGYEGPELDRAEWGMQEDTCVVLEPGKEFRPFAHDKGWQYAGDTRASTLPRLAAAGTEVLRLVYCELQVLCWFSRTPSTPADSPMQGLEHAVNQACQKLRDDLLAVAAQVQDLRVTVREEGDHVGQLAVWHVQMPLEPSAEECAQWRERLVDLTKEFVQPLSRAVQCTDMRLTKRLEIETSVALAV